MKLPIPTFFIFQWSKVRHVLLVCEWRHNDSEIIGRFRYDVEQLLANCRQFSALSVAVLTLLHTWPITIFYDVNHRIGDNYIHITVLMLKHDINIRIESILGWFHSVMKSSEALANFTWTTSQFIWFAKGSLDFIKPWNQPRMLSILIFIFHASTLALLYKCNYLQYGD